MKFDECQFPEKEKSLAPSSDYQCLEKSSQDDSDDSLGLVMLNQPLPGPNSPGPPTQVAQPPQPLISPMEPPGRTRLTLPDMGTAPTPQYSLHPRDNSGHVIKLLDTTVDKSLSQIMIHMFQDVPNSSQEAMKWTNSNRHQKKNLKA